ncbi:helix-turn-helix transcriptional regulator [Chitinophaga sp. MM2321]|uniref:helix-turn-helix transcriptional regulator n=1 Tax=Chitinophaga sp. MM2321 TaxID=3137178 RepID=UPI0032D593BE
MKIEQYLPSSLLKPFIKTFMIIESENGMESTILPGTSLVIALRLKGGITYSEQGIEEKLPPSVITGLRKSPRLLHYTRETATLLVVFREGGAATLFKEPLHELFGISLPLDYLIGRQQLNDIEARLAEAESHLQRIAVIEKYLLSIIPAYQSDQLITHAIEKIHQAKGNLRIKDLATDLHISQDPFEKRFRRVTGASPKQFASILRLRNLIDTYSPTESLAATAYTAGYFDQAHFIKDFKSFTGQTPHLFFASASYW